jgi:hypothetical protein
MLTRRFFTPAGNGLGPGFLRRNRIRLPLTVVIIFIYISSSNKPKRCSFTSRQRNLSWLFGTNSASGEQIPGKAIIYGC